MPVPLPSILAQDRSIWARKVALAKDAAQGQRKLSNESHEDEAFFGTYRYTWRLQSSWRREGGCRFRDHKWKFFDVFISQLEPTFPCYRSLWGGRCCRTADRTGDRIKERRRAMSREHRIVGLMRYGRSRREHWTCYGRMRQARG